MRSSEPLASGTAAAKSLLKNLGYGAKPGCDKAADAWKSVAGPLGQFSRAGEIKRGTFTVVVSASAIVQELRFRERELLFALIVALPDQKISRLRFQTGRVNHG